MRIFDAAVLNATYKSLNWKTQKTTFKMKIIQLYSFKQIKAITSDQNSASLATAELPLVWSFCSCMKSRPQQSTVQIGDGNFFWQN